MLIKRRFLVNTSGSGKTRLLYEGLCQNWGFYFTSILDVNGLGSCDIQACLAEDLPKSNGFLDRLPSRNSLAYSALLETNVKAARRRFREILLARLLVFRLFIETVHELHQRLTEAHKKWWLMLQLYPRIDGEDINNLLASYFQHGRDSDVDAAMARTLDEIYTAWDLVCDAPLKLFLAVDEANSSSQQFVDAFSSEHGSHSILVEILRTWRECMPSDIPTTLVVAGTQIPRQHFLHDEWNTFRWTSNTGAFETRESQKDYILRFFPKSLADSPSGEALINHAWDWCRGRFEILCCAL